MKSKRILILGGTGMLGHVLLRTLSMRPGLSVSATARSLEGLEDCFPTEVRSRVLTGVDANDFDGIARTLNAVQPDAVVNCIGIIKQLPLAKDPLASITINAQLPHRLARACRAARARLIHISTDCVFDGKKGNYSEADAPNADDLYGQTKMLGEVQEPNCVTLRTSIIGHELRSRWGLVEWFLSQTGPVRGFTKAIYSGFSTIEMARIVGDFVLTNPDLRGIYNVSSDPLSKYDLLRILARSYEKNVPIEPDAELVLDRSLDSSKFRAQTGYVPPPWELIVDQMHADYLEHAACYRPAVQG